MTFKYSPRWQDISDLLEQDPGRFYGLMEDRERALEAHLAYQESVYTPDITGSVSSPALGDTGYAFGAYTSIGGRIDWTVEFLFSGAAIGAGSGNYFITLPVPARTYVQAGTNVVRDVGGGYIYNGPGNAAYNVRCIVLLTVGGNSTFFMQYSVNGAAPAAVSDVYPVAWVGAASAVRLSGTYSTNDDSV